MKTKLYTFLINIQSLDLGYISDFITRTDFLQIILTSFGIYC